MLLLRPFLILIPASLSQAPETLRDVHCRTVATLGIFSPWCLLPLQYWTLGALP